MGLDQLRLDHWVSDTRSSYDAMLVVVNRLTKLDHFIQTTTRCSARKTADLLFSTVWGQHGLSLNIGQRRSIYIGALKQLCDL